MWVTAVLHWPIDIMQSLFISSVLTTSEAAWYLTWPHTRTYTRIYGFPINKPVSYQIAWIRLSIKLCVICVHLRASFGAKSQTLHFTLQAVVVKYKYRSIEFAVQQSCLNFIPKWELSHLLLVHPGITSWLVTNDFARYIFIRSGQCPHEL